MLKRTLSAFAAAICLASCAGDLEVRQIGRYHLDFEVPSDEAARTALTVSGAKVSFFWKNETSDAFEFIQSALGTTRIEPSTSFSVGPDGKATVGAEFSQIPGATSYDYVGIYPRGAVQTVPSSLSSCTLNLPSVQALSSECFDPAADLLFSRPVTSSSLSQGFSLSLRRLAAIGKMTILNLPAGPEEKIMSVKFISPDVTICGPVKLDLSEGTVLSYESGTNSVTLESADGLATGSSVDVWFTCLPFSLAAGAEFSLVVHTDRHCYIKDGTIPSGTLRFSESNLTCFDVDMAGIAPMDHITYEMYGAAGDGIQDDMPAIVASHNAANEYDLPVIADDGKTYLIGNTARTAIIKTNVEWGDAHFIINDNGLDKINSRIFVIQSGTSSVELAGVSSLGREATNLGITLPRRSLVEITDENKKIFIRNGSNANDGSSQTEYLIVDADGTISPSTPVTWDYAHVTSLVAYPMDEKPLTVRGGIFTTKVSQEPSEDYYSRGIVVSRSNTRLVGIKHYVEDEGPEGAPYHGFFTVNYCSDVILDSILFTAHKTYYKTGALGTPSAMGSYDLSLTKAVNVTVRNCAQSTPIVDSERWGVMGSNFCRNVIYEKNTLSRFDAHQGVYNATISDCVLGEIDCTGFGTLTVENTEIHSSYLMTFRGDYGAFWRGNVIFRNCKQYPSPEDQVFFLHAYNYGTHDFGYDCMLPSTITFENLKVYDGNMVLPGYSGPQIFTNVTRKTGATFSYQIPQTVNFSDLWVESGKKVTLGPSADYYSGTKINGL